MNLKKFFETKYRVTSYGDGFIAQWRPWYSPFWLKVWIGDSFYSYTTVECAEYEASAFRKHRNLKRKHQRFVKYLD